VSYTPTEVGPHIIKLNEDNVPVDGSPFTCNVYDVSKIQLAGLPKKCAKGEAITFTVDASKAGEGNANIQGAP
jgi:filamin